jgi:hypothetical protein
MRETIFLVVSRQKVEKLTKSLPMLSRGQIPVKLVIEVAETAFREPVIERYVKIDDWREGIDISDVDFKETFITEEEAAYIRQQRLARMAAMLTEHGYLVKGPEPADAAPPE